MWKELARAPKRQHLAILQRPLDDTARRLSVRVPIVATPGIFKLTLDLGFYLYHCDNFGTGLHQFELVQYVSAARKVLKACSDQHQVIAGAAAAPYLADATTLTSPDSVSLPATLAMSQGSHARMRVVLVALFGKDHPTVLAMKEVNT